MKRVHPRVLAPGRLTRSPSLRCLLVVFGAAQITVTTVQPTRPDPRSHLRVGADGLARARKGGPASGRRRGGRWEDHGLVFPNTVGKPINPEQPAAAVPPPAA